MSFTPFTHLREPVTFPANTVAVLPLGAVEAHGPHLPLGTDGLIADGIIDQAARAFDSSVTILRLPLLWLGASAEHAHRAGTLSHEPEALVAQIVAVAEGLHAAGVQRLVLFNGHGGNVPAGAIAALKLRTRFGMLVASAHWLDFGLPADVTPPSPARADVHGGWIETSVMLHLVPDLVRPDAAQAQPARSIAPLLSPHGPVRWGWTSADLGGGWIGNPELADARLGAKLAAHAAQGLCSLLTQLAAAPWPVA